MLLPCGKTWLLQNNFSAYVRPEHTNYVKMVWYAVPRVCVKSEVYIGLKKWDTNTTLLHVIICRLAGLALGNLLP